MQRFSPNAIKRFFTGKAKAEPMLTDPPPPVLSPEEKTRRQRFFLVNIQKALANSEAFENDAEGKRWLAKDLANKMSPEQVDKATREIGKIITSSPGADCVLMPRQKT